MLFRSKVEEVSGDSATLFWFDTTKAVQADNITTGPGHVRFYPRLDGARAKVAIGNAVQASTAALSANTRLLEDTLNYTSLGDVVEWHDEHHTGENTAISSIVWRGSTASSITNSVWKIGNIFYFRVSSSQATDLQNYIVSGRKITLYADSSNFMTAVASSTAGTLFGNVFFNVANVSTTGSLTVGGTVSLKIESNIPARGEFSGVAFSGSYNDLSNKPSGLPTVTGSDNGDILTVVGGAWSKADPPTSLPTVTGSDNGDVLTVVSGAWAKKEVEESTVDLSVNTGLIKNTLEYTSLGTIVSWHNKYHTGKRTLINSIVWRGSAASNITNSVWDSGTHLNFRVNSTQQTDLLNYIVSGTKLTIFQSSDSLTVFTVSANPSLSNGVVSIKYSSTGGGGSYLPGDSVQVRIESIITARDEFDSVAFSGSYNDLTDKPSGSLPAVTGSDNGDVLTVVGGAWSKADPPTELPTVSATDNGDVLTVVSGAWAKADPPSGLPTVSATDNGDVLTVVNGAWAKAEPASGSGSLPTVSSGDNGDLLRVVNGAWAKSDLLLSVEKTVTLYTSTFVDITGSGDFLIGSNDLLLVTHSDKSLSTGFIRFGTLPNYNASPSNSEKVLLMPSNNASYTPEYEVRKKGPRLQGKKISGSSESVTLRVTKMRF